MTCAPTSYWELEYVTAFSFLEIFQKMKMCKKHLGKRQDISNGFVKSKVDYNS